MGLLQLHTQIDIHATPAQIWRVLTDFASYPEWNPFIRQIEGEVVAGERLRIRIQPPGQGAMRFTPRLVEVAPEQSLRWLGHWLVPGLLDGEHHFELLPQGPGTTRLVHSETFSGLIVGLLRRRLAHTRQGFEAMNHSLKTRAEVSVGTQPEAGQAAEGSAAAWVS